MTSNVIPLFGKKRKDAERAPAVEAPLEDTKELPTFLQVMNKNLANDERLRKERAKANVSVLKSYRIKNEEPRG